jgi:hypothetical protein
MLKQFLTFIVVLVVGILVFLVMENYFSHSFQSCVSQKSSKQSPESSKNERFTVAGSIALQTDCSVRLIDTHNGFFTAFASFIIAAFTAVLGIFTVRLAGSTRIVADATKKSAKAIPNVERAYVFISDIVFIFESNNLPAAPGDEKESKISVTFDNVGKTPAIPKTCHLGIVSTDGIPAASVIDGLLQSTIEKRVVAAGATLVQRAKITIKGDWRPRPVTMHEAKRVFLAGILKYLDVFDGRHETCFCWQLNWERERFEEAMDAPHLNYER